MIRGEPSDRVNLVQDDMRDTDMNYEVLKELLKDPEFRKLSDRVLEMQMQVRMRHLALQAT